MLFNGLDGRIARFVLLAAAWVIVLTVASQAAQKAIEALVVLQGG